MIKRIIMNNIGHRPQTFCFHAPDAKRVQLVGDFTHWTQKPINLEKTKDGYWVTSVDLPGGIHHYRFLVDGEWRDDPEAVLRVANPYGSQNSVTYIG